VIVPGVAALICLRRRLSASQASACGWIAFAAASYFFLMGPFMIKTRYTMYVYAMLSVLAAAGFGLLLQQSYGGRRKAAALLYGSLMLLGMLDSTHVLLKQPKPDELAYADSFLPRRLTGENGTVRQISDVPNKPKSHSADKIY
jgi:hypothetical protein